MLAVIVAGLVASALSMHEAQATQIDGTIGFAGTVIFDSSVLQNVTQVNEWHDIFGNGPNFSNVANVTGTYASFRGGIPLGTQVTMAIPWVFTSATPGLWSVRGFTFKLLSARIVMQTGTFLDIIGTGIISHAGFDDTPANWAFTVSDAGGNPDFVTFEASAAPLTPGSFVAVILSTEPANLQGYWKCDETSGTTLADSSGNSKNLTITGAINTNYWLGESGEQGTCFRTDGVAGYARRNEAVIPSLDNQDFTLFALFKGNADFNVQGALAVTNSLTKLDRAEIGQNKPAQQAFGQAKGKTATGSTLTGGTAFDGSWHSITFRRSRNAYTLFVDGVRVSSVSATPALGSVSDRTSVMHPIKGGEITQYAKGSIQHAAIWNIALSDSEIMAIQTARTAP